MYVENDKDQRRGLTSKVRYWRVLCWFGPNIIRLQRDSEAFLLVCREQGNVFTAAKLIVDVQVLSFDEPCCCGRGCYLVTQPSSFVLAHLLKSRFEV